MEHRNFLRRFTKYTLSEEEKTLYESIKSVTMKRVSDTSIQLYFQIDRAGKVGELKISRHRFFNSPAKFSKHYKDITGEPIPKKLNNPHCTAWSEFRGSAYSLVDIGIIT